MPESPHDSLLRALSEDGGVAVRALIGTELVREAHRRHATRPLATAALGRALLGAVLLGAQGKDGETLELRFRGRGPLGSVIATADCEGRARGYVSHPGVELALRGGKVDVAGGLGLGELVVVRFRPGWREPYTGIVPIVSGEIAQDIALYLTESEQTPSAVALGVYQEADGEVGAAGGFLVQALPGAADSTVKRVEQNVLRLPALSEWIRNGATAAQLVERLLAGVGSREPESSPVHFHCGCDDARVLRAVSLLGRSDLEQAMAAHETLEVRCVFCGDRYDVDPERARALLLDA
jgi:molecular chaperone Hsp33